MKLLPLEVAALLAAGIDVAALEAGRLRGGPRSRAVTLLSRMRNRPRPARHPALAEIRAHDDLQQQRGVATSRWARGGAW